jgi:gliding motility-associated-like protein
MKVGAMLAYFSLCTWGICQGQSGKQNNHWVFGTAAKLEFHTGNPNAATLPFNSIEACATASDPLSGALLFYSDGVTVRDKNGDPMPNGTGLKGSTTSSQGALILPHPENARQYLLFTTPSFSVNTEGLYYSVLDMNLNGGLGDITAGKKNILLYSNVVESLNWTYNHDSSAYWLMTHKRDSDSFLCFEIKPNSIGNRLVTSKIGRAWTWGAYMSTLCFSPDRTRLAVANILVSTMATGKAEVYRFDPCRGTLSDEIVIQNLPRVSYGIAFAPGSKLLYITNMEFPSSIYQVNIAAGNEAAVNASLRNIFTAPKAPVSQNRINYMGGMQLADDGKIYVTEMAQPFLHCINNPDGIGNSCQVEAEKIKLLSGTRSAYALPRQIPEKLKSPVTQRGVVNIKTDDSCSAQISRADFTGLSNPENISWKFYRVNGSDTVRINDSLFINLRGLTAGEYIAEVFIRKDCRDYAGVKRFRVTDCICAGEIRISDTCANRSVEFSVDSKNRINGIRWTLSDSLGRRIAGGSDRQLSYRPNTAGRLYLRAIVNFSCGPDTLDTSYVVRNCPRCDAPEIPNAFTPNKDGLNDTFRISSPCGISDMELLIYNRWGGKIYEGRGKDLFWDGTYMGRVCPEGAYFFLLDYRFKDSAPTRVSGTISLFR